MTYPSAVAPSRVGGWEASASRAEADTSLNSGAMVPSDQEGAAGQSPPDVRLAVLDALRGVWGQPWPLHLWERRDLTAVCLTGAPLLAGPMVAPWGPLLRLGPRGPCSPPAS